MKKLQVSFDLKNPSLSRSKYRMLPFTYVESIKKTYPFLWNAGLSELADDAFHIWASNEKGESVDFNKWIKQREKYGDLHASDVNILLREKITPRNAGVFISLLKWGIIPHFGIQKTKSLISDLVDSDWTQSSIKFEKTYDDYPSTAIENCKRAIAQLDTKVGKRVQNVFASHIARKIAQGFKLTIKEIEKIASFIKYKHLASKSYEDSPSTIVWDSLGGTNGVMWAKRRVDSFKRMQNITPIEGYKEADAMSNETCNSCLMAKKGLCEQYNSPIIGNYVCKDWQDNEEGQKALMGIDSQSRRQRKEQELRAINFNRACAVKAGNLVNKKQQGDEEGYDRNEYIKDFGWVEYSKWFLGENTEYSKSSMQRYIYPVTSNFKTISLNAIKKSKTQAGLRGHRQILEELIKLEGQAKHIIRIEETEDSLILEFGKDQILVSEEEGKQGEIVEKNSEVTEKGLSFQSKRSPTFKTIKDKGGAIVDYQDVKIAGYGSTNEDVTKADRTGDYLRKGAFKKTIPKFMNNPVMLADHSNSTKTIVGKYTKVEEDKNGLYIEGELSNSPEQKNIRFQVAEGNLQTMSIGGIFKYEEDGKGIEEVDLMEISLVAIPMNPDARFIVKEINEENIEKN